MIRQFLAALGLACVAGFAAAQDMKAGEQEYMTACAGCHGESARGDGPLAGLLKIRTPDLTRLSRDAGGVFPFEPVLMVIDGRKGVRAHGSEMPVWGDRYRNAAVRPGLTDQVDADMIARGRMMVLVNYLASIQE